MRRIEANVDLLRKYPYENAYFFFFNPSPNISISSIKISKNQNSKVCPLSQVQIWSHTATSLFFCFFDLIKDNHLKKSVFDSGDDVSVKCSLKD